MAKNIFMDSLNNRELMDAFGIQQDNAPMTPEELQALSEEQNQVESPEVIPVMPENAMMETQNNPMTEEVSQNTPTVSNVPRNTMQDGKVNQETPPTPRSRMETLLEEYNKLSREGMDEVKAARESDRMLKVGGALGDALATIINARSQMNVKAPGVQVRQGAGLGKIADMFATAPEVQSDIAERREALMEQYRQLARGEGQMSPYQKMSLDLAKKRLALAERIEKGRSGRAESNLSFRQRTQDWKEKEGEELKPKEMETLTGIDTTLDSIERLEGMNTEFLTGPIEGRISAISRALGTDSAKKTQLAAQMEMLLSRYAKQISGTAVGEQEFERLRSQLPKETDSNQAFAAKLANFKDELTNTRNRFINEYGKVRDITKFKSRDELPQGPSTFKKGGQSQLGSKNVIIRRDPKSGRRVEYDAETKKPIRFLD